MDMTPSALCLCTWPQKQTHDLIQSPASRGKPRKLSKSHRGLTLPAKYKRRVEKMPRNPGENSGAGSEDHLHVEKRENPP